jgi:hypothetical protein
MSQWELSEEEGPNLSGGKYNDDELLDGARRFALAELERVEGFMPEYRHDIKAEEDFSASPGEMPLIAVWGERIADDGHYFSISINSFAVESALVEFMHPDDPLFDAAVNSVISDLRAVTRNALVSTIQKTGQSAEEICNSV